MALLNLPILPFELYVAVISPVSPGAIGVLGQLGVVQPQEAFTFSIINGDLPSLVNENTCVFFSPSIIWL